MVPTYCAAIFPVLNEGPMLRFQRGEVRTGRPTPKPQEPPPYSSKVRVPLALSRTGRRVSLLTLTEAWGSAGRGIIGPPRVERSSHERKRCSRYPPAPQKPRGRNRPLP